jgi:TNF receptor-associated factor 4
MSLFVCVCKGEYDAIQSWPFSLKIKLTMLDQNEEIKARRHVSYLIKPNPCKENMAFLGKPTNERNASFGSQRFIDLIAMNASNYISNDSLFIKAEVENQEALPF